MKIWKKNLVAAAVLVTVCAGIYVNWLYTEENAAANLIFSSKECATIVLCFIIL